MERPLGFVGVAHPPAGSTAGGVADLSNVEISMQPNMGVGEGTKILVEHDHSAKVGAVLASWQATDGSLHVRGNIHDAKAKADVRSGALRGLSLGTGVTVDMDTGRGLLKDQEELSICEAPARRGCYVTHLDHKPVRAVVTAASDRAPPTRERCPLAR